MLTFSICAYLLPFARIASEPNLVDLSLSHPAVLRDEEAHRSAPAMAGIYGVDIRYVTVIGPIVGVVLAAIGVVLAVIGVGLYLRSSITPSVLYVFVVFALAIFTSSAIAT
jgi:hypothetical protein